LSFGPRRATAPPRPRRTLGGEPALPCSATRPRHLGRLLLHAEAAVAPLRFQPYRVALSTTAASLGHRCPWRPGPFLASPPTRTLARRLLFFLFFFFFFYFAPLSWSVFRGGNPHSPPPCRPLAAPARTSRRAQRCLPPAHQPCADAPRIKRPRRPPTALAAALFAPESEPVSARTPPRGRPSRRKRTSPTFGRPRGRPRKAHRSAPKQRLRTHARPQPSNTATSLVQLRTRRPLTPANCRHPPRRLSTQPSRAKRRTRPAIRTADVRPGPRHTRGPPRPTGPARLRSSPADARCMGAQLHEP